MFGTLQQRPPTTERGDFGSTQIILSMKMTDLIKVLLYSTELINLFFMAVHSKSILFFDFKNTPGVNNFLYSAAVRANLWTNQPFSTTSGETRYLIYFTMMGRNGAAHGLTSGYPEAIRKNLLKLSAGKESRITP